MRAPRLNRRMCLEERSEVPNGSGGLTRTWVERAWVWAAVEAGSAQQVHEGGTTLGRIKSRIVLRAGGMDRPLPGQRLREGGRVFSILAVGDADPDARYVTCHVQEEVAV